jgi:hypothetical protein
MHVFEHARFRTVQGLPRTQSRSPDVENSLLAGKNAGNFPDSALSCENPSLKYLLIQVFAAKFPTERAGNFFARAGN